jgi:hypothetical protein
MAYRGEQAGLRRITGKAFPRALPVPPVLPSKCVLRFSRCCAWQLQSKFHPQIAHVSSCDRTVSAAGQIQSFPFRQEAPFHEAAGTIFCKPFPPIFSQSDIAHSHQLLILQTICSMIMLIGRIKTTSSTRPHHRLQSRQPRDAVV